MSPTLHDRAAVVGLLMDGDEIPFLHDMLGNDLGFQVNKNNNAYSTFINTFNGGSGPVGETEHKAFLIFWIYCFFIYTSSVVVVEKFTPYVIAILNWSYLNTGVLFLLLLYKGLFAIVSRMKKGKSIKSMFRLFWFLQLWIQQYFLEFSTKFKLTRSVQSIVYNNYYTWFPFLSLSVYEVVNIVIKM